MLLWTLSGIVMMYKPFPELNHWERLQLQLDLNLDRCCQLPDSFAYPADTVLNDLRLDMHDGQPVLRFTTEDKQWHNINLTTGKFLNPITAAETQTSAAHFIQQNLPGTDPQQPSEVKKIERDQWTVYSAYHPHRPLYHAALNDTADTEIYISSRTGEIVQLTTAGSRLWGYLGAVVHWIYPTALRQYTSTWYYLVVTLSLIGCFLTLTGLYVGLKQFKRRRRGRLSPYKGWALFHHYCGLIFGIVTLTWVASGLLSMNPLGALEGSSPKNEQQRLQGMVVTWKDLPGMLRPLEASHRQLTNSVRLTWETSGDQLALIRYDRNGNSQRYDAYTLMPDPLRSPDLEHLSERILPDQNIASTELLAHADTYYYPHHNPVEMPIYRIIADDQTRYYLSPITGSLVRKIDGERQWYRWLFHGLHRGDFTVWLRSRPIWDVFMLVLLTGVTVVCGTGTYMGIKRLQFMARRRRTRRQPLTPAEARP